MPAFRRCSLCVAVLGAVLLGPVGASGQETPPWRGLLELVPPMAPGAASVLDFPAPMRLPPPAADLLTGLDLLGADFQRLPAGPDGVMTYEVVLASPDRESLVVLTGALGRDAFTALDHQCTEAYCASTFLGAGPPTAEVFTGLATAGGAPGWVEHDTWKKPVWRVSWFDQSAGSVGVTYQVMLQGAQARVVGQPDVSRANRAAAQALLDQVAAYPALDPQS